MKRVVRYCKSKRFFGLRSFTLLELLIALGIVAIISTVGILILNPAEILRQSRDANRLAELASLERAIRAFQAERGAGSVGAAGVLYISLPDDNDVTAPVDDCSGLALPSLPLGWRYRCATSADLRRVDGNGWLPVDLRKLSTGSFSSLPVDPLNRYDPGNFLNNYFYLYATDGVSEYELNAKMESSKYGFGAQ